MKTNEKRGGHGKTTQPRTGQVATTLSGRRRQDWNSRTGEAGRCAGKPYKEMEVRRQLGRSVKKEAQKKRGAKGK